MSSMMDAGRPFDIECNAPVHDPLVVVTLHPDWMFQFMANSPTWLEGDDVFEGTLKDLLQEPHDVRRRYRIACPVCGDRGAVVELREEHLEGFRKMLDLRPVVSRVDISALARYLST